MVGCCFTFYALISSNRICSFAAALQKYDNDPVVKAAAATVLGSKLGLKADLPPELQAQILPAGTPGTPDRSPTGLRSRRSSAAHPSRTTSLNPEVSGQDFTNPSPGRLSQDASREGDAPQASYSVPAPAFDGFGLQPRGNWQPGQHESGGFVGVLERVAQMLVGEDPTQCYALICETCRQHNGERLVLVAPHGFQMQGYLASQSTARC